MDATNLHKNLMDKIASDPEIINRSIADTGEQPVVVTPPPQVASLALAPQSNLSMGSRSVAPAFNLLAPNVLIAQNVITAAQAPLAKKRKNVAAPVIAVALVLFFSGSAAAYYVRSNNLASRSVIAKAQPSPVGSPLASALPPTPTPAVATATPVLAPATVTAPTTLPTIEHPQNVSVTSRSGLWLRSTPTSINQKNVISWMPYNGAVSVDTVGDFWWHGTYLGKSGYFAVNYTK